jgi:hypothetical protein
MVSVGIYAFVVRQFPTRYQAAKVVIGALLDGEELEYDPIDYISSPEEMKREFRLVPCQVALSFEDETKFRALAAQHGYSLSQAARQGLNPVHERFV